MLGDKGSSDATPLAYVEERVNLSSGASFFIYYVGDAKGWEMRRKEAMKQAEKILDGIGPA